MASNGNESGIVGHTEPCDETPEMKTKTQWYVQKELDMTVSQLLNLVNAEKKR